MMMPSAARRSPCTAVCAAVVVVVGLVGRAAAYVAPGSHQHHQYRAAPRRRRVVRMIGAKPAMPDVPDYLKEPGLKVPATAWKWPRTWPFGTDGFAPSEDSSTKAKDAQAEAVFDERAAEALAGHVARHVPSGAAVLVVDGTGAGATYIPEDGAAAGELWFPPSRVDVVAADSLDATSLAFEDASFDVVLVLNAAEQLRDPRASFRELWRVLKPSGRAIAAFSAPRCSPAAHAAATTKMWRDYNDAQRLWVVGSFFHFSAGAPPSSIAEGGDGINPEVWGAGWRSLRGYDYFDDSDKGGAGPLNIDLGAATGGAPSSTPLFVLQADKARAYEVGEGATAAIDAALWAAPSMEEDDKRLCATRLLELVAEGVADDVDARSARREALAATVAAALPDIYSIIKPMQSVIATPLLAQLAANLAPRWNWRATDAQRRALREGLGLDPPRDAFWKPLGAMTSQLTVDDKLWLLLDVVPLFDDATYPLVDSTTGTAGGDDASSQSRIPAPLALVVPVVLPAVLDKVARTLFVDDAGKPLAGVEDPKTQSRDCQLLAVDILARDYLPDAARDPDGAAERFLAWLETLTKPDLKALLDDRLAFRETAKERARLAALDPEAAAQAAEDLRRAQNVEAMLNDITRQLDARKAAKKGGSTLSLLK